jgi:beta-galactosidase
VEARERTRFDDRGLVVVGPGGARHLPYYAGAMHYWRVEPARWDACLRAMHDTGFTIIDTYVPWRVHEVAAGKYDWTGERDLARFITAARAAGLAVVLRPGPAVNAELTSFGIPDRVLADPACQARTAQGTPAWLPAPPRAFPIPSYASAAFQAEVRGWYAAVAAVVQPFLGDPVVAIGIDNEAQLFFRTGAFDLDYHVDALAWWSDASGLSPEDAPRSWTGADARIALWMKFKDEYLARALGCFAKIADEVGLGEVARFHNLPPGHYQLHDLRRLQHAVGGPVGIDAYTPRAQFPELRRRAAALVGDAAPLPLACEVGVGFNLWFPPLDVAAGSDSDTLRERDHVLTLLAAGIRGVGVFMAVERDRYYGAAIDAMGKLEASWLRPLFATLAEVAWPALRRPAAVALVDMRADERFGIASSVLDPVTPVLADVLGLGPGGATELGRDPGAVAARRWQAAIARALELARIPFAIVDEGTPAEELARYRAVIAPTGDRVSRGLWQALRTLVDHKAQTVVVVGPTIPTRDELDQPIGELETRRMGRLKAGSLDDLPGLAEDLSQLAGEGEAWQVERPDGVRAAPFADATGRVRVVFVTSDRDRGVSATIAGDAAVRALRDPFTGERFAVTDGRATVAMHAGGVRMLVVE